MRITKFWAKGYRSLRDVTLDGLGDFNVFYGPNGSGKSNILAAVGTLFDLLPIAAYTHTQTVMFTPTGQIVNPDDPAPLAGEQAMRQVLRDEDFYAQEDTREIVLGAQLTFDASDPLAPPGMAPGANVELEVTLQRVLRAAPRLTVSRLRFDGADSPVPITDVSLLSWLCETLPRQAFGLVDAVRALPNEVEPAAFDDSSDADPVLAELGAGRLKSALFAAKNLPRGAVRFRFERMQEFMSKQLGRPGFDVVRDPKTREIDMREMIPPPNPYHADVPLSRAGLGVVQVYAIIATIMFARKHAIAIEEPEAHLHAPSMGRLLRKALVRMVTTDARGERLLDQLFIATHSNLFDLDPTGYWDVSMVDGETRATRRPLHEIDAHHLYEPGPAKHALTQLLRYAPESEVVFRRPDGSPVTAGEMLLLLQEDDDVAVDFLHDLHGAALRIVRLDARRKEGAA